MIYPTLHISPNTSSVKIYDTNSDDQEPILVIEDDNSAELFMCLLDLFMEQYDCGYAKGYEDCMDDTIEDE